MRNILGVLFLLGIFLVQAVMADTPAELLRQQFKSAYENPGPNGLKLGKLWDCYFVNAENNHSYTASYKFTDFNGVIRGTYNHSTEHAYSHTTEGLKAKLSYFISSYIRATPAGELVIEITTKRSSSSGAPYAISNSDVVYEYALCKTVIPKSEKKCEK